jgi:glycosyltransferase involved in cell wall biosynthesis
MARFAPDAHMTVLPSPIDLARFVPSDKKEAKALLGFPDCSEKWVLFNALSLQNPIKRFDLAKQAFDIAQARHGNLRLRLATDLPHDALPLFTASCDLIVCTSENEGWPNSIKEALACNVPFVSTDVSDLRDIAGNEPSCRICPPDAQVIADNICDVLAGPEPKGLRQYVLDMSLDATGERLISAYESVLERYRRSDRLPSANSRHG